MNLTRAPQKILIRAPNWIGDQILAYPCFQYLRAGYPTAQITAVCQPWVASVQFRHLVDEVYVLPQPTGTSAWARARALGSGPVLAEFFFLGLVVRPGWRALAPWLCRRRTRLSSP